MRKEVSKWLEIKHYSRFCIRYLCVCAGFRCRIVDIVDRSDRFLAVVNILNVYGWERNWLVRIVCENIYLECETMLCNAAFVLPQPIRSMVLPLMCSCALLILPCRSHLPMSYEGQLHFVCILRWTVLLFTVFIIAEIVHKIKQSVFARLKKKCCWNVKEIYMCLLHFYEKRSIIFIKQKSFL